MITYISAFIIALITVVFLTPVIKKMAVRFNAIDIPDERRVHSCPTPRWGGLSIAVATISAVFITLWVFGYFWLSFDDRTVKHILGLLIGGILMMIVGAIDDRKGIPAKIKLVCQILVAIVLIKFDIIITFLKNPANGELIYLPWWFSWALTIFWIVGITNAINLLDGLDGLLAGVSAIIAFLFFIISLIKGQTAEAIILMAIAGACIGFLRFNFNPASIFMGDSGSLFLGLMFAGLSITGGFKTTATAAIFIPIIFLGLPIFDTSSAIIRRFLNRRPIFSADKEHIHHQLLAQGLSQKQTVLFMYLICGTLGAIGLSLFILMP